MELTVSTKTVVRVVLIVLASVFVFRLLGTLRTQLIWIFTAFFLAVAIDPAVNRLSRYVPKKNRILAVLAALLILVLMIVLLVFALVPPFVTQVYHLIHSLPSAYSQFVESNTSLSSFVNSHVNKNTATDAVQQFSNQLGSFGGSAAGVLRHVFGGIFAVTTVLLLTFFMVLEGPAWVNAFWDHFPNTTRSKYSGLAKQLQGTVTGYVNGNLVKSGIATVASVIMLFIIGSPYAMSLGLLVGVLDLIPMVGATLAAVVVCLAVLVFKGLAPAVIMAVFFIIFQQVENNILQPIIFSKTVEVSPLVTMVALTVGVALLGFIGALVAIPVAASTQILLKHWLGDRRNSVKKLA